MAIASTVRPAFRDPELQRVYDRQGYVVVRTLEDDQIARLLALWNTTMSPALDIPFAVSVCSDDFAYRAKIDPEIRAAFAGFAARELIDYRLCVGSFLTKRGDGGTAVAVHTDTTMVDESRFLALNMWTTLVDVAPENGCLRMMPGSHLLGEPIRGTIGTFRWPGLIPMIEERYLVDVPMVAGETCFIDPRTIHASYPNNSGAYRVCTSALAVPSESELRYCYQEYPGSNIDLYHHDDEYFRTHVHGSPPDGLTRFERVPDAPPELTPERLAEAFAYGIGDGNERVMTAK
ncbi:MAG: phytanoyl-CoA dioxygenase family protein [Candidatus Eremiobacteraeota bacterium]|nr:phytanoyl-CoA dioxygenase family protein [Candidatus Eremiobacteraeota bacterium]